MTVIAYGNHRQDFCTAPSCCAISYEIETICNNVSDVSARFAAKVLATPTKHNAHKSTSSRSSSGSRNPSTLCHVSPGGNVIGNYIICRGAATAAREREGVGETEAGQAFAARNVNIAVDTHTERVSRRSYRLQFNFLFLISRRIFIIFKPNICDFAAFPLDRVGGQARRGQSGRGVNKLSTRRRRCRHSLPSSWSTSNCRAGGPII